MLQGTHDGLKKYSKQLYEHCPSAAERQYSEGNFIKELLIASGFEALLMSKNFLMKQERKIICKIVAVGYQCF
jgi:hypothetical protein